MLLHPTSLPNGVLDREAYRFVDWLAAAGQSWWQVLPIGPPDEYDSPYRAESAFAAWRGLLADPDAPVSPDEEAELVARERYWIGSWTAFAGEGAVADQVRFEREWKALRAYAAERGVRLYGDVPIYVSEEGADVEAWPELFDRSGVAGAPPDPLNERGQHWGNPLYDWEALKHDGYRWWTERFRRTFALFDLARVDHFRGFAAYWAEAELGPLPVVGENLGVITPDVEELRRSLGFPGMVVLQWAFDGPSDNPHRPENHTEDEVVYTSTHDTDTAVGWARERGLDAKEPHWELIRIAMESRAQLAIVPVQDVLGLGSDARMNRPGEREGNWSWRLRPGQLTDEHAQRLRELTLRGRRYPAQPALSLR